MTTVIIVVVVAVAAFVFGVLFGRKNKNKVETSVGLANTLEQTLKK